MRILDQLDEQLTARAAAADEAYRQLVRDVADERRVDDAHALDTLRAAGKSLDTLRADVRLLVDRRKWRAAVDAHDAARERLAAARETEQELLLKRDEAVKRATAAIDAELARQREIIGEADGLRPAADQARERLRETAPADRVAQFDAVRERASLLNDRLVRLRRDETNLFRRKERLQRELGGARGEQRAALENELQQVEADLAEIAAAAAAREEFEAVEQRVSRELFETV